MITVSAILGIVLVAIVLVILFKILGLVSAKLGIDQTWITIIYLVVVLLVVIWAFGMFGITQPIIR
jgi:hypothetical protein